MTVVKENEKYCLCAVGKKKQKNLHKNLHVPVIKYIIIGLRVYVIHKSTL